MSKQLPGERPVNLRIRPIQVVRGILTVSRRSLGFDLSRAHVEQKHFYDEWRAKTGALEVPTSLRQPVRRERSDAPG